MDSSFGSVVCLGGSEEIYHGQMKKGSREEFIFSVCYMDIE